MLTDALGQQADVSIRIGGAGLDELRAASSALASGAERHAGGSRRFGTIFEAGCPDSWRGCATTGAATGIGAASLGRQLRQAFHGEEIRRVHRGRNEVRVLLRSGEDDSSAVSELGTMPVRRPDGRVALLGEVADVARESGESVIRRVDSARAVTVFANVDSALVLPDEVIAQARNRILPELAERFRGYDFQGDREWPKKRRRVRRLSPAAASWP